MRSSLILSLVCLTTLVAGCSGDESAPESSGEPETLCEVLAPAVPEDWGLTETSVDTGEPETACTLADEAGDTRLIVSVLPPESGDVDAAFAELCDTYVVNPQQRDDERCTATGPVELEGSPATVDRGVRLDRPATVLWIALRTNDPDHAAGTLDVLSDVESAISED